MATASGVNHTVRLPRARRPASYAAHLVTRCRCFAMWRRQAALALNGTAEIQASGKGPSSYTAQLPTPTGRSVQQGVSALVLSLLLSTAKTQVRPQPIQPKHRDVVPKEFVG